jgi:hypothetical protein
MATKKALTTKPVAAKKTPKADKPAPSPAPKKVQAKKVADIKQAAKALVADPAQTVEFTVAPITVVPPPARKSAKDEFLRYDPLVSAANLLSTLSVLKRETAGEYDIAAIADEGPGYGARLRVLKALRGGPMVVVKEAEPARLKKELYELVGAKTAGAFALKCALLAAEAEKSAKRAAKDAAEKKKADLARAKADIRRTAWQREVHDGVPVLDAPVKMSKREAAADSARFKAALAARVRASEEELAEHPIATPRPGAPVEVDLDAVRLLVDPSNGITLLQLEAENSQGAICVYNNGRRVAAGVVATETLKLLRPQASDDLVRDVNQMLHPLTADVVVTPVAERHLTALLKQCKEKIDMATEKTKKFAPPIGVAKKAGKPAKAVKEAKAPKAAKEKAEGAARKSSLFRLLNDAKPTWSAFTTQKKSIVDAFVKLGAVGAKAAGVTRGALVEALPGVPDKNISFYLSKWQPAGIVEKLPAAE